MIETRRLLVGLLAAVFLLSPVVRSQSEGQEAGEEAEAAGPGRARENPEPEIGPLPFPDAWSKALDWRSIGPANMGGRIVALSVFEADPKTWWAATASGGLIKTTDDGFTFEHQFDRESMVSIGDVAVAQSNRDIVWVGTGENNPRNSASWGNGVYKSVDGGKTWSHMGLKETFQIGRIAVHPTNPDIVYVGAMGRLWGPNEERGLYKTEDGGKTWQKILYVDERTGVIEMQMDPQDPETLLVATYERKRDIYCSNDPAVQFGPGAALYKTSDGGKSFRKITAGLPTSNFGRIGLDYFRKNPDVVYMLVECENIGKEPENAAYMGLVGEDADAGARVTELTEGGPAAAAGLQVGDIVLAVQGTTVLSYRELTIAVRQHVAGDVVKLDVSRNRQPVGIELTLGKRPERRPEGGRGGRGGRGQPADPERPFGTRLGGQVANIQEQQGPNGHEYGGLYRSDDGGESWRRVNSINPRPMYFSQVRVDPNDDNHVWVLGVSSARSKDGGKTFTEDGGRGVHADGHAQWINPTDGRHIIHGCDGGLYVSRDRGDSWDHLNHVALGQFYHVGVDSTRAYKVYGGLQDNGSWGGPSFSRDQRGPINQDWIRIGGGDGFLCFVDPEDPDLIYYESQNGATGRRHLGTGASASIRPRADRRTRYRFNWRTPFLLSRHNGEIYYVGGNRVFRSLDRGEGLRAISPDITATDKGSATALGESPFDPDQLWVGTDDGALWVTHDGGKEWRNIFGKPAAPAPEATPATSTPAGPNAAAETNSSFGDIVPGPRYVDQIVPSAHRRDRVYVCLDGHRSNDDAPYLLVTEDAGETWRSLTTGLPEGCGSTRTIVEDRTNENILWVGTEFSAYVSIDRGRTWTRINGDLPTVAVHAFAQSPACSEVVAATHGRSLWILDATPIRQATAESVAADAWLFQPDPAYVFKREPSRGDGNRRFVGENPPSGAVLHYALGKEARAAAIEIRSLDGKVLRRLDEIKKEAGLHRLTWDLRRQRDPNQAPRRGGFGGGRGGFGGARVSPGSYVAVLITDGNESSRTFEVKVDPENADGAFIAFEDEEDERLALEAEDNDESNPVIIY